MKVVFLNFRAGMYTSFFKSRSFGYTVAGIIIGLLLGFFALKMSDLAGNQDFSPYHLPMTMAILGSLAFLAGGRQDRIEREKKKLEDAKKRFTSLTHSAIKEQDWMVSLHDSHIPTCWEVKGCQRQECPAHGKHHIRCWLLAGTQCPGEPQGTYAQKLGDCSRCEIYREAVSRGPIDEIAEDFNSLIWAVSEKEEMLGRANEELTTKVRELCDLQKKTREIADTDALTGLRNYGHFQKQIKQEVAKARRYGRNLALLMLDIEDFKRINDEFGHKKGDQVLKNFAKLLAGEIGEHDYAARYGGEKFAIIIPETYGEEAIKFATKLQQRVRLVAEDSGIPESFMAIRVGISDFPDCATHVDGLLSAADSALLFARRKRQTRIAYFCDLSETELCLGDLEKLNSRLEGAGLHTIRALAEAVDAADLYSGAHRSELVRISKALAGRLEMGEEQSDCLALAACLHDIGKIGVPAPVLRKTEKLSAEEIELVKKHPEIGRQLLNEINHIQNLVSAILYHHERWDGKGYPEGLKGENIPVMARIIGILDAYRAMMSDRPYRGALSKSEALEELRKGAGTQFDPRLVELFLELVESDGQTHLRQAG